VNDGAVMERYDRLPPEPASASAARRLVADAIGWSPLACTSVADTAALLVSEVVTNAVLHAGTAIRVKIRVEETSVRVEVRDGSVALPSRRHYDERAVTGRGLELVDLLATTWGTEQESNGKVVWFEVSVDPADGSTDQAPSDPVETGGPMWTCVRLLRLPTALLLAALERGEAAMREIALVAFSNDGPEDVPAVTPVQLDLGAVIRAVSDALGQGLLEIDLEQDFPPSAEQAAIDRLAAVDEADRMAMDGNLLILPAVPELGACRRWMMGQITQQLRGEAPVPWVLPGPEDLRHEVVLLGAATVAIIDARLDGAVVADIYNRIVHLNPVAADLLGWAVDDLVGRRLTTVIPPEHRTAHLAGFTRYQVTAEGPLIGATIEVPMLCRDGSLIPVRLTIDVLETEPVRPVFRACFTVVDTATTSTSQADLGSGRDGGHETVDELGGAALEVVAAHGLPADDLGTAALDDGDQLLEGLAGVDGERAEHHRLLAVQHGERAEPGSAAGPLTDEDQPVGPRADDDQVGLGQRREVDAGGRADRGVPAAGSELVRDDLTGAAGVPGQALADDDDVHGWHPPAGLGGRAGGRGLR
jgi:PAS domain S-box-containing protein